MQAFTNSVHGYDHERNLHTSNVMLKQKSVHCIDSSMLKLFEFGNLSIFFLTCAWMILSYITSWEVHKLWKLWTVHWCYQPVTIKNYFLPTHKNHYDLRKEEKLLPQCSQFPTPQFQILTTIAYHSILNLPNSYLKFCDHLIDLSQSDTPWNR